MPPGADKVEREGMEPNRRPFSHLLQLPREIRDLIYEVGDLLPQYHMLDVSPDPRRYSDNKESDDPYPRHPYSVPKTLTPAVFQVCQQLRAEALQVLGSRNYFNILFYPGRSRLFNGIPNMRLLQWPFMDIFANIKFLRLEMEPGFIASFGDRLASHLVWFAPRLERLTIIIPSRIETDNFEKGHAGARFLETLLGIPSLKVLRLNDLTKHLMPIARRLGQVAHCRVEFICDGDEAHNGPPFRSKPCVDRLESPEERFIKEYTQNIETRMIQEYDQGFAHMHDVGVLRALSELLSKPIARYRYQILGVMMQPTAGLTRYHTLMAFEEGHQV